MKSKNLKYLVLLLSLAVVSISGISLTKITQTTKQSDEIIALSGHSSYVGRDIAQYSKDVNAIILGSVSDVGEPYLRDDRGLTSQQDIKISVSEVIKGDIKANSDISLLIEGGQNVLISENQKTVVRSEESALFSEGEKVLLFLGMNSRGDYVSYAGPYGKYLIDEQLNVTSIGGFEMSLSELKDKIKAALAVK